MLTRASLVLGAAVELVALGNRLVLRQVQAAMAAVDHLLGSRWGRIRGRALAAQTLEQQPHRQDDENKQQKFAQEAS